MPRDACYRGCIIGVWKSKTTYRELKVEQGMEKLRSRTPESVGFEVAGHMLLYLLVRWTIVEAAIKHSVDPLELSFLAALNEIMACNGLCCVQSLSGQNRCSCRVC